jgi:hypothetical protein
VRVFVVKTEGNARFYWNMKKLSCRINDLYKTNPKYRALIDRGDLGNTAHARFSCEM